MSKHFSIVALFISLIWLLASSDNAYAAAKTSAASGNWSADATWCGNAPVTGAITFE